MPAPTITPLPTPPSRSTDPTNFAIEADAFVAALPEFVTDANAQASYLDGVATAVDADAAAAAASAADALESETNAAASAAGAASAADVSAWVSGATYAIGVCVFSPIDFQTYRRTTNGAGTTDPSADIVNWVAISGAGGGGSITAVASGTLSDGTKVVLNNNGTVSAVSKTITPLNPPTVGTLSNGAGSTTPTGLAAAYDKTRKLVFVAAIVSSTISVFIGEVVGSTITFQFTGSGGFSASASSIPGIVYDDRTQQVVIAYRGGTGDTFGYAYVGTVAYNAASSVWSIAFGSQIAFNSNLNTGHVALALNPDNSTVLIGYMNSNPLLVRAATLGLRTMTLGTAVTIISSGEATGLCYIGNNNFAVSYRSYVAPTGLNAAVISVSGTTATVNTPINLSGATTIAPSFCACDISAQRLVVTYVNSSTGAGLIYVVSISGTTLAAGGSASVTSSVSYGVSVSFNPDNGRFVFAYVNSSFSGALYAVSGLISGTSIALGTIGVVNSATSETYPFSIFRSDAGDTIVGSVPNAATRAAIIQSATITANLTTDNFVGISDGAYLNGENATIQTVGAVDDAQSGLTPGRRYFVGEDGNLKLQSGDWEPVVYAGVAVNATSLLIKG